MGSYFLQRSHLCLSEALSCKWLAVGKSMLKRQFRCVPHLSLYFLLSSTVSYCWRLNRGPKGTLSHPALWNGTVGYRNTEDGSKKPWRGFAGDGDVKGTNRDVQYWLQYVPGKPEGLRNIREGQERVDYVYCFVFQLPENMVIIWNKKMRKTAGYCVTGQTKGPEAQRYARIELSEKVCDSAGWYKKICVDSSVRKHVPEVKNGDRRSKRFGAGSCSETLYYLRQINPLIIAPVLTTLLRGWANLQDVRTKVYSCQPRYFVCITDLKTFHREFILGLFLLTTPGSYQMTSVCKLNVKKLLCRALMCLQFSHTESSFGVFHRGLGVDKKGSIRGVK